MAWDWHWIGQDWHRIGQDWKVLARIGSDWHICVLGGRDIYRRIGSGSALDLTWIGQGLKYWRIGGNRTGSGLALESSELSCIRMTIGSTSVVPFVLREDQLATRLEPCSID